jgi:hypothetical protein
MIHNKGQRIDYFKPPPAYPITNKKEKGRSGLACFAPSLTYRKNYINTTSLRVAVNDPASMR